MASIAARAARLPGRGARLVLLLARVPLLGLVSLLALVPVLAGAVTAAPARAAVPPPLSGDLTAADISSTYGSGAFGRWSVDPFGLPVYDYTLDQQTSPLGPQAELGGNRDAWHQVGNDRVVADAFNHGYVQLWSQDRLYQWMNHYDASSQHYAGGYGYLRVGGRTYSTLYDDRPPGAATTRRFGPGYYEKTTQAGPIAVTQRVYAPFGDDPLLLDEVTLRNTSSAAQTPSWFEYWDVNPAGPPGFGPRATGSPSYDAGTRTLSVAQLPNAVDTAPLSIFAAALQGPVSGFDTDTQAFFGAGSRAAPAAVTADHTSNSIAPPNPGPGAGRAMFAMRSPLALGPGQSVTLRYAYGYGHPQQIAALVARYRSAPSDPFTATQRGWADWLPQASFGPGYQWLARELQWDAYTVRSGTTYEECAGRHIISQGGYYQYGDGFQGAFRDPLQHVLPMIYADPALARDVLVYSAQEQPQAGNQIPYAIIPMCARFDLGTSDDLDLWLMLTAAEYGLASRDSRFFDLPVRWSDSGAASLWDHLRAAFGHQEAMLGPHGGYLTGATGDWSDFSTQFLQMTESMLVTAQAAYIYPRLAELADLHGDSAFAAQLRAAAARDVQTLRAQWTGQGWYSRGYSGQRQVGQGVIFGEPQPWAILAGAPNTGQDQTLVANIRRYLSGVGAPGGPSRIGSSQSPAANDPGVTERSQPSGGVGDNNAVYVGGVWFAVNGWLTWALGELDGIVPHARDYAFDELVRNSLATHASVYPGHWDGVISVDDVCRSWYSTHPEQCGNGLSTAYDTQIMHQPAWSLFDVIKLAGVDPTRDGYRVVPHLPMSTFSLRLPEIGVAQSPGVLRGYVRPEQAAVLRMRVAAPPGADIHRLTAFADGRQVPAAVEGGLLAFNLPSTAGQPADWAVAAPGASVPGGGASGRCASRRDFRIRLGPRRRRLRRAAVYVNGRRVRVIRGRRLRAPVDLRGLLQGIVHVRILEVTRNGRRVTRRRTYHTCIPRLPRRRRRR